MKIDLLIKVESCEQVTFRRAQAFLTEVQAGDCVDLIVLVAYCDLTDAQGVQEPLEINPSNLHTCRMPIPA